MITCDYCYAETVYDCINQKHDRLCIAKAYNIKCEKSLENTGNIKETDCRVNYIEMKGL